MKAQILELEHHKAIRNEAIRRRKYTAIANKVADSPFVWCLGYVVANVIAYTVLYQFMMYFARGI